MSQLPGRPWVRPFFIIILILTVPPLLYWFLYVQSRVDDAQRRAFGTLAAISSELKDRVDTYDTIAKNLLGQTELTVRSTLPDARVELNPPSSAVTGPRLTLDTELDLHVPSGPKCPNKNGGFAPSCSMTIVAISPATLIPWDLVESEFDGLLVFAGGNDGAYDLLAQDRRLPAQPLGEPIALHAADKTIDMQKFLKEKASVDSPGVLPLDFRTKWLVRVAGKDYLPFVQRVRVPVHHINGTDATSSEDIQFIVCGLIETDQFRREAIALSPDTLVVVTSLVALGLFAIPFLKLRFIGRRERMRPSDVWLLSSSVLAGTALIVLLILYACTLSTLQERFDHGLRSFANTVNRHVSDEVALVQLQLDDDWGSDLLFSDAKRALEATKPLARASILTAKRFSYPLFETLFYVDSQGQQQSKLTPRTIPTGMVKVDSRPYFPDGLPLQRGAFTFTPDVAITTGLTLGTFAIPASLANWHGPVSAKGSKVPLADRDGIIALATPLPSLIDTVISRPFQFVVLNRERVVYQSASGPYRGERFLENVPDSARMRHAAQCHSPSHERSVGSYSYRGRHYRMFAISLDALCTSSVPPLPTDTVVVTYYDTKIVESLAAQAFGIGAVFSILLIAAIHLGAIAARFAFGPGALEWAWPSKSRWKWYVAGIAGSAAFGVTVLAIWCCVSGSLVFWCLLLGSGIAIFTAGALCSLEMKRDNKCIWPPFGGNFDGFPSRNHRGMFVAFGVMAIIATVVIPVMLAVRDAYAIAALGFEDAAARQLDTHWQGRAPMKGQPIVPAVGLKTNENADTRSEPMSICDTPGTPRDVRCIAANRIYASQDNYDTFTALERKFRYYDTCVDLHVSISCRCSSGLTNVETCESSPSSFPRLKVSDPASWAPFFHRGYSTPATRPANGAPETGNRSSEDPPGATREYVVPAISAALLVLILMLVVRSLASHVLGLDLRDEMILDRTADFRPCRNRRWILLRPPVRALRRLLVMPKTRVLDLHDTSTTIVTVASDKSAGESVLVVQHVEYHLSDESWRAALRQILRSSGNRDIVLVSEIDPFHYVAQHLREMVEALELGIAANVDDLSRQREKWQAELADWAVVLRHAEKIRYAAKVVATRKSVVSSDLQKVADRLRNECGSSGTLLRIAAGLLRRRDLGKYSWKQIVSFVLDAAEPYYRSVWDLCSRDEKLVLIQLAEEGLVNPKNVGILRRLSRRRLVTLEPRFRLINDSFREFVLAVEPPERVAQWEGEGTMQMWKRISIPLYTLAAVVVGILLFTEQALVANAMVIVTGAAGALGSLRTLYAQIRPTSAGKTP